MSNEQVRLARELFDDGVIMQPVGDLLAEIDLLAAALRETDRLLFKWSADPLDPDRTRRVLSVRERRRLNAELLAAAPEKFNG